MDKLSSSSSPCLSTDSLNETQTSPPPPPPYQIPSEISKFHQQNGIDLGLNKNPQSYIKPPMQNNRNPFGIEALLAMKRSDLEPCVTDNENNGQIYLNRKYKEHIISRTLNDSPDENMSR